MSEITWSGRSWISRSRRKGDLSVKKISTSARTKIFGRSFFSDPSLLPLSPLICLFYLSIFYSTSQTISTGCTTKSGKYTYCTKLINFTQPNGTVSHRSCFQCKYKYSMCAFSFHHIPYCVFVCSQDSSCNSQFHSFSYFCFRTHLNL